MPCFIENFGLKKNYCFLIRGAKNEKKKCICDQALVHEANDNGKTIHVINSTILLLYI